MVAEPGRPLVHARFLDLADHLDAGDLLIVNASATLPAALPARRATARLDLHLSTPDPGEPRPLGRRAAQRRPPRRGARPSR